MGQMTREQVAQQLADLVRPHLYNVDDEFILDDGIQDCDWEFVIDSARSAARAMHIAVPDELAS